MKVGAVSGTGAGADSGGAGESLAPNPPRRGGIQLIDQVHTTASRRQLEMQQGNTRCRVRPSTVPSAEAGRVRESKSAA